MSVFGLATAILGRSLVYLDIIFGGDKEHFVELKLFSLFLVINLFKSKNFVLFDLQTVIKTFLLSHFLLWTYYFGAVSPYIHLS